MFSLQINSHEGKPVDGRYGEERKIKKGTSNPLGLQVIDKVNTQNLLLRGLVRMVY